MGSNPTGGNTNNIDIINIHIFDHIYILKVIFNGTAESIFTYFDIVFENV